VPAFKICKRIILVGLIGLLLLGNLTFSAQPAVAANSRGTTLAAWYASDLAGVHYRYGGSTPGEGLDNSGLVYHVYQKLGVNMPRSLSAQAKFGSAVAKSQLTAGDLVFFKGPGTSSIVHVGIYLTDGDFAASSSSTDGVARRNLNTNYYLEHYVGARRVASSQFAAISVAVGQAALETVGMPYASGQATAQGVDNTGLMSYIFRQCYLPVPSDLSELASIGVSVSKSQLRPGDMVFFSASTYPTPYRVGMYVGNSEFVVIDQDLGRVVKRSLNSSFYSTRYLWARRPYADFTQPASFSSSVVVPSPQPQPQPQQPEEPRVSIADQIVALAQQQIGKRYVLGSNGPNTFDCSGLTRYVFGRYGYNLPRASYSQATTGAAVAFQNLEKGDLVFFRNTWRNNGAVDHVAIYIGEGKIVHAITSGVKTNTLSGYWLDHYAGARRVLKP
jgi:cell wall-associated NlpC family hydrolase